MGSELKKRYEDKFDRRELATISDAPTIDDRLTRNGFCQGKNEGPKQGRKTGSKMGSKIDQKKGVKIDPKNPPKNRPQKMVGSGVLFRTPFPKSVPGSLKSAAYVLWQISEGPFFPCREKKSRKSPKNGTISKTPLICVLNGKKVTKVYIFWPKNAKKPGFSDFSVRKNPKNVDFCHFFDPFFDPFLTPFLTQKTPIFDPQKGVQKHPQKGVQKTVIFGG